MSQPVSLNRIINESNSNSSERFIAKLAAIAAGDHMTDIHLRRGATAIYKTAGQEQNAVDWGIGENEVIPDKKFDELLNYLLHGPEAPKELVNDLSDRLIEKVEFTRAFLVESKNPIQMRVQYCPEAEPPTLFFRFQPANPFLLSEYLAGPQVVSTIDAINRASGLFLVCGGFNNGKTSLLHSIVEFWAAGSERYPRRHVAVLADPVEYYLPPTKYHVTTIECALTQAARESGKRFISEVIPSLQRMDVKAIAVGEIRDPNVLKTCINLSAAKEPVLSTIHAASIPDCVVRVLSWADEVMSPSSARLLLASKLEGIFHVAIGYVKPGDPSSKAVPIVQYLPCQTPAVRKAICQTDPKLVQKGIADFMRGNHTKYPEMINRSKAIEHAKSRGLNQTIAEEILGPEANSEFE